MIMVILTLMSRVLSHVSKPHLWAWVPTDLIGPLSALKNTFYHWANLENKSLV